MVLLYYNEIVSSFSGNKKLVVLIALLVIAGYLFRQEQANNWLGQSRVLGEEVGPAIENMVLIPAKKAVEPYVRWPQKEDLEPLPKLIIEEKNQEPPPGQVDFDQSLENLTEEIKKLPQQQLTKVKEQLVKEIFPDCQCVCE
ncbi:MAG: hypothetical protein XD98_0215 [Microgenomates bacterium 39_6]|nr:MAG: hypothetical protein XD98_0215 [Microgenomates bacterium 39_6]